MRASHARAASAAAAALAASASIVLLAACGGGGTKTADERQYAANAVGLIDQLHGDLVASSDAVGSLGEARRVLRRSSDLYTMLMAYGDFGGCNMMLRNVGEAGERFARVRATLESACRYLERGSRLFTTAATRSDPGALLAATHTTQLASPLLYRARIELLAATRHGR